MQLKVAHLFLLSVLSGLMLGFSFPFTGGLFPLAFLALVPLLIINHQLNLDKVKGRILIRFACNYTAFVIFNAITTWWVYYASPGGVYMAVLANSFLMTLPFAFYGFVSRQLGENKGLISIMVFWLAFEHLHYFWELSWPWLELGHVFGTNPMLIQWYEYSGVAGGTWWLLIINIIVFIILKNIWFKKESWKIQTPNIIFFFSALIIPIVSSLIIHFNYEEKEDPVDIVIVQPNIEAWTEKFVLPVEWQLNKMFTAAAPEINENTDLVLLPETALPVGMDDRNLDADPYIALLNQFQAEHYNVPWLIGADTRGWFNSQNSIASRSYGNMWYENYNTALMVKRGMAVEKYHKSKLVLGGEKLPFVEWAPFLAEYAVELGGTSGLLGVGDEPVVFEAKGVYYAPLICYESVYGDYASYFVRKGAEIICVITNDGWWRDTPGYKQHRMFSQIRAIENRRSVARSANTGISCFIDQKGEIISEIGWDQYGVLHETINKNSDFTFFTKYGSLIGRIGCFLGIGMLLYGFVQRMKGTKLGQLMSRK